MSCGKLDPLSAFGCSMFHITFYVGAMIVCPSVGCSLDPTPQTQLPSARITSRGAPGSFYRAPIAASTAAATAAAGVAPDAPTGAPVVPLVLLLREGHCSCRFCVPVFPELRGSHRWP